MRLFPLGYPVEILSRQTAVLEAAAQRWSERELRFDAPPLRFTVDVSEAASSSHPIQFRPATDSFTIDYGEAGQGEFDVAGRAGTLRADPSSIAPMLELLILTALDWTFFIGVHAACVMRDGRSVLLCGDSQAGKSTLSYACGRSGWTFVSDNALHWAGAPWDVLVSGSRLLRLRDGAMAMFSLDTREVDPAEHGMRCDLSAPAGPLVFLQRRPGPAVLTPYPELRAMTYLAEYDTRPDRIYAEERYRALMQRGVWALEYEDVGDAVRSLETLL